MLLEYHENLNSMDYALNELDKGRSEIFVYLDRKKLNKSVTIIQGLRDKNLAKQILKDLKKKIGTGGCFKNGLIVLQGKHKDYVKEYLKDKNILR